MIVANYRNISIVFLFLIGLIFSSHNIWAQNDTIKLKKITFKSVFDNEKKADGISIALPDKMSPLFDLNPKKELILKDFDYYINLDNNSSSQKKPNFMSSPNHVDDDVLVQRNFNGKDTSNPTLKSDVGLGTIESSTKSVRIEFRDHGLVDGDRVRIFLNEEIVDANITLQGLSAFIDLNLKRGYNRIDFMALNQGLYGPNTAQFIVFDDKGKVITAKAWNINKGNTATLGIVRY